MPHFQGYALSCMNVPLHHTSETIYAAKPYHHRMFNTCVLCMSRAADKHLCLMNCAFSCLINPHPIRSLATVAGTKQEIAKSCLLSSHPNKGSFTHPLLIEDLSEHLQTPQLKAGSPICAYQISDSQHGLIQSCLLALNAGRTQLSQHLVSRCANFICSHSLL